MLSLKKAAAEQLVVEVHRNSKDPVLLHLQRELKEAKVVVRQSQLDYEFRVNFYMSSPADSKSVLKKYASQPACLPTLSLLYLTDQMPPEVIQQLSPPTIKTLMLREALPKIIEFDYEVHNTQDEKESLEYLIDTVKILVESESIAELSLFDQHAELKSSKHCSNPEKAWMAMLHQLPGIGIDKAETIAAAFPTAEQLYQGIDRKELENLPIRRGEKLTKLGPALSDKIARVFTSRSPDELI